MECSISMLRTDMNGAPLPPGTMNLCRGLFMPLQHNPREIYNSHEGSITRPLTVAGETGMADILIGKGCSAFLTHGYVQRAVNGDSEFNMQLIKQVQRDLIFLCQQETKNKFAKTIDELVRHTQVFLKAVAFGRVVFRFVRAIVCAMRAFCYVEIMSDLLAGAR